MAVCGARDRKVHPPDRAMTHFGLAGALGLKGDTDGAKTSIAELLKVKPEVNSLARFRDFRPWGQSSILDALRQNGGDWPAQGWFPRRVTATGLAGSGEAQRLIRTVPRRASALSASRRRAVITSLDGAPQWV
jgi:hypothetical protein